MLVTIEFRTVSCGRERLCEECIVWVFFIHKSVIVIKSKLLDTHTHKRKTTTIKTKKQNKKITNAGGDVRKGELLFTTSRNVNLCSHYGNLYGSSSKS